MIIIISLSIYTLKKNPILDNNPGYIYIYLLIIMWNVCQALEISALQLETKIIWNNIQLIPISLIPPSMFWLVVRFTSQEYKARLKNISKLLLIVPICFNILLWSKNFNSLIIKKSYIRYNYIFPVLGNRYGPLFWVFALYNIILIVCTLTILGNSLKEKFLLYKEQISIIFIGLLFPSIFTILYILEDELITINVTLIVLGISGIISLWVKFIYGLFDIIPIARSLIIQEISTGVIVIDNKGRILDVNLAARKMLGITSENPVGINIEQILKHVPQVVRLYKDEAKGVSEVVLKREGFCECYEVLVTKLKNSNNRLIGYLIQLYDVTERKVEEENIKYEAFHDALTGLPNRNYFIKLFNKEVAYAKERGGILALAYLDLDDFKYVNDNYGHGVGDLYLCEVSKLLKETLRKLDIVSRFGGDEYVILLPAIRNDEDIKSVGNKILNAFNKNICVEGSCLQIKASIGFSVFPRDGEDIETLLKKADEAMYKVKGESKNNFSIYNGK